MRHRIPIQKVNLQWNYATKKLDLVDHYFSPYHGSVNVMSIEIVNGKISQSGIEGMSRLFDNIWGIGPENIYEFFKTYYSIIPKVNIFEDI
jgi:hypothetical protein